MLSAFFSALICIITRAILNVCDRGIFRKKGTDFLLNIFYNALFPFLVSWGAAELFGDGNEHFVHFFFQPGIIFSALGAQLAATAFSQCFRTMPVKSVVVSSKIADLLIPLMIFLITSKFSLNDYCFSCLSTLLFLPIIFMLIKNGPQTCYKSSLALILILIFQAGINAYFLMNTFADTWPKFLSMMTCILLWRSLFILIPWGWRAIQAREQQPEKDSQQTDYLILVLRAFLAFISQASFFYSITRISGNYVWPLLNSTPLVACFAAHVFLNEAFGKIEICILGGFIVLSTFYLAFHWSFL